MRIVLVDDDEDMLAMLADSLRRQDISVMPHSSGRDALSALGETAVDAMVVDKEMPEMNGFEVLGQVRRRWPALPVIIITAFGGDVVAKRAKALGAAAYLEKPFRLQDLLTTLRRITAA
jgi:DNA-binding response OmpR family regulator